MKRTLFVAILLSSIYCYSQDTLVQHVVDTSLLNIHLQPLKTSRPYLYHFPRAEDKATITEFAYLLKEKPTENNYRDYYKLACSLWQLNKTEEAEILFLNIIGSQEKWYTTTYHHSSDVSGNTSTKSYGYGSSTSNYKNGAALYLAKLYIEQKNYAKALRYLEDAVQKYIVTYTCGTGIISQREEYTALYTYCYEGLGQYDKVLDVLLPHFQSTRDEMLVSTVKRLYKPNEIDRYLQAAVSSMKCTFDTLSTFELHSTHIQDKWDTIIYYSGHATINLFGRSVKLYPLVRKGLKKVTKELLIQSFKESQFYQQLANTANPLQHTKKGFEQVGLGRVTSADSKSGLRFWFDQFVSAFVHNFNNIFSINNYYQMAKQYAHTNAKPF